MKPEEIAALLAEAGDDYMHDSHAFRLCGPSTAEEPHRELAERCYAAARAVEEMAARPDMAMIERMAVVIDPIAIRRCGNPTERARNDELAAKAARTKARAIVEMVWGDKPT
jgi:hypothetical protein